MRQWAEAHDERDEERFGAIFRILAVAGVTLLGATSWSLKTQYEGMQKQVQQAQIQLAAIQQVRAEVQAVSKPPQ